MKEANTFERARRMKAYRKHTRVRVVTAPGAGVRPKSVVGRTGIVLKTENDGGVFAHYVQLPNRKNPVWFWVDELEKA